MNRKIKLKARIGLQIRRIADSYGTWLARNPERGKLKQWILSKLFMIVDSTNDSDPFRGECW